MKQSVVVRPVAKDDFSSWKTLWDSYNAFYGRQGETALSTEIVHATWLRFFDAYEPVHALVAEQDGELIGLAHFLYHRSTIQLGPNCYLQDLFTIEATRGKGVGRALIQAVAERAQRDGCGRLYWQTHETNAAARRLYDQVASRSGFIVYVRPL